MPDRPLPGLMGILNVTPDSFSDGGRHAGSAAAIAAGIAMHRAGAAIVDVGGESTRPGATPVPADEELRRTIPVVEGLVREGVPVSIDTMKAAVMRAALAAGATLLNDVSALSADPDSLAVAAGSGARVVLMHMPGTPQTMQANARYDDVVGEVRDALAARIAAAEAAGIPRARLIADPGIGFGKGLAHNLAILRNLAAAGGQPQVPHSGDRRARPGCRPPARKPRAGAARCRRRSRMAARARRRRDRAGAGRLGRRPPLRLARRRIGAQNRASDQGRT
jgi:dihydropteroate synthase